MKIPAIKKLCENYTVDQLQEAELHLLQEKELSVDIPGDDEGEKLTHILAAIWIKTEMDSKGCDVTSALRNYSQKVRKSIS